MQQRITEETRALALLVELARRLGRERARHRLEATGDHQLLVVETIGGVRQVGVGGDARARGANEQINLCELGGVFLGHRDLQPGQARQRIDRVGVFLFALREDRPFGRLALERGDLCAMLFRELVVLAQRRQIFQIAQAEELEELFGRAVEQGTARLFALAEDAHERAIHERLQRAAGVDAADLVDLGARDGLTVGADCQRLEQRA